MGANLPFIQPQTKENIKASRPWPLFGEFIGDRWIPRTNGQLRRKRFHLMISSCERGFWRVQYQISSSISKSIEFRESTTPHWKVVCGIHWCEFKLNWPVSLSCLYEPFTGRCFKASPGWLKKHLDQWHKAGQNIAIQQSSVFGGHMGHAKWKFKTIRKSYICVFKFFSSIPLPVMIRSICYIDM